MLDDASWPQPIDPRGLPAQNAVAIYLLELHQPAGLTSTERYLPLLATVEYATWQAIRPLERQWQYLQSRVLQRLVLAAYVERDPQQLTFERNQWGRPSVTNCEALHFSLSHCASHVALAVGSDPVLGVDVETVVPVRGSFMHIARQYFHRGRPGTADGGAPRTQRYGRFLEQWTLKEAYLKATRAWACTSRCPTAASNARRCWPDRRRTTARRLPDLHRAGPRLSSQRRMRGCQLALAYRLRPAGAFPLSELRHRANALGGIPCLKTVRKSLMAGAAVMPLAPGPYLLVD